MTGCPLHPSRVDIAFKVLRHGDGRDGEVRTAAAAAIAEKTVVVTECIIMGGRCENPTASPACT